MIPHYGKREPGGLTAASPGDTLYLAFASYNDSGDSEALSGLAVTDIEVIKNGAATVRATDSGYSLVSDTGQVGDRAGLYRCSIQLFNTADDASFYASGSWYQAFVDAVTIDGRTVRFWLGSWEIGRQKVNVAEIDADTGAADQLQKAFASGFNDTGVTNRFDRIQSEVDTGLRVHIDDSDTGLKDALADLDTGLRGILNTTGVNVSKLVGDTGAANWLKTVYASGFTDTGLYSRLDKLVEDTGFKEAISDLDTGLRGILQTTGVNVTSIDGDTGAADQLRQAFITTPTYFQQVDVQLIDADTGAATHLKDSATKTNLLVDIREINASAGAAARLSDTFANGFNDTGINQRFAQIQSDVDTGVRAAITDLDTGLRDYIDNTDTGIRAHIDDLDTGIKNRFDDLAEDTGGVNVSAIAGDTGAADRLLKFAGSKLSSDGMVDTGTLAGTQAGTINANVTYVNETQVQGSGASNDEWRPV